MTLATSLHLACALGIAGQLAGSITAAAWASLPAPTPAAHPPTGPPFAMLLLAATLLEVAGRLAAAMQSSESLSDLSVHYKKHKNDVGSYTAQSRQAVSSHEGCHSHSHSHSKLSEHDTQLTHELPKSTQGSSRGPSQGLSQLFEGFRLIAKSSYLCHVCLHFVLHYLVSTFFYFEKTLVVASGGGSASQRVATFATINSMSAGAVALIQLTATVSYALHHNADLTPHHCFTVHHTTSLTPCLL